MSRFTKFAKQQFHSLNKHLGDYRDKKEPGALHQIRVDIKKIKSILLLVNDRVRGFRAHKNYIPFRNIFRRAGEIREPEVISGLLLAHNIAGVHDKSIDGNNTELVSKFCADIPASIDAVNKQWTKLEPVFKKIKAKDLDRFLRKTKKHIKSKLYPKPDMDLIHRVRKSIKAFIYLSETDHQKKKKLMKFYKKEVETIGELHDRQVLLNLVTKQNGKADKTVIKKIRKECADLKDEVTTTALKHYGA